MEVEVNGSERLQPLLSTDPRPALPAFDEFYLAHARDTVKALMYLGATADEAEDIVADTMEYLLTRWDRLEREVDNLRAYLMAAAARRLYKLRKRGSVRLEKRMIEQQVVRPEACDDARLRSVLERQPVMDLLQALPPAQREVLALAVDQFTPAQIAELLGKDPNAIRKNLSLARKRAIALRDQAGDLPRQRTARTDAPTGRDEG